MPIAGILLVAVLYAAGCTYRGATNPVSRKFTWFSYLNADDLRADCKAGAPSRYRFVYNGVYVQQVRTYDIIYMDRVPTLRTRVIGPMDLSSITILDPLKTLSRDPLSLFDAGRGTIVTAPLRPSDLDDLDANLARGRFFGGAPDGLRLASEDFFWLGAVCISGHFYYNAYKWPTPAYDNAAFPALLAKWDDTGIPFNRPRQEDDLFIYNGTPRSEVSRFDLTVGENGLVGIHPWF